MTDDDGRRHQAVVGAGAAVRRAAARLPALDLPRACRRPAASTRPAARTRSRPCRSTALLRGAALTVWRLLRCAPWHPGGVDPVPPASPPVHRLRTGRVPTPGPARPRTTRSKRRAELHLLPGVGHPVVLAQGLRVRVRRGQRHRLGAVGRVPRVHPARDPLQAVRAPGALHAQDAGVRAGDRRSSRRSTATTSRSSPPRCRSCRASTGSTRSAAACRCWCRCRCSSACSTCCASSSRARPRTTSSTRRGVESFNAASLFGAKLGAWVTMGAEPSSSALGTSITQMIIVMIPLMIAAGIFTHITARHSVARQTEAQAANPQTAIMNKLMLYVFPIGVVVGAPFLPLAVLHLLGGEQPLDARPAVRRLQEDRRRGGREEGRRPSPSAAGPRPAPRPEAGPPETSRPAEKTPGGQADRPAHGADGRQRRPPDERRHGRERRGEAHRGASGKPGAGGSNGAANAPDGGAARAVAGAGGSDPAAGRRARKRR